MIPNASRREVESSGVSATKEFGLSRGDEAHLMNILRDALYSDKVLAVLREYSSNAWDSHRESNKKNVPIKVVIPTMMDPTLIIRDFGAGLSHEDVFEVYTQYGASTKRNSDDSVGMLGIGSKSGFAYSDQFTITSWNGGFRRTYVAVIDESEKGTINLLETEECGDETGVQIQIPVRPQDIYEFTNKARELFKFFVPRPDINIDLPVQEVGELNLTHGSISGSGGNWVAVMGCVPYRVNLDQLKTMGSNGIAEYINNISGSLFFNIGEVQVNASREELKYGTATKNALVQKLNLVVDEYVHTTMREIDSKDLSIWSKRCRAKVLGQLKLPIPKDWEDVTKGEVRLQYEPESFEFRRKGVGSTSVISVDERTRLLMRDDDRSIAGYILSEFDYVVTRLVGFKPADVEKELTAVLSKAMLTGVPILNISSLSWIQPEGKERKERVAKERVVNTKHKVTTFRLLNGNGKKPWSDSWGIEEREPTDEDVFVIINGFRTKFFDIYQYFVEDCQLAKSFGAKMPPIYGYKTTKTKPVSAKDCAGTEYLKWREKFAESLVTDFLKELLVDLEWVNHEDPHRSVSSAQLKLRVKLVDKALGVSHPISQFFRRWKDACEELEKGHQVREFLPVLLGRLPDKLKHSLRDEAKEKARVYLTKMDILKTYSLLALPGVGLEALAVGKATKQWAEYVELVDRSTSTPATPPEPRTEGDF